MMTMPQQIENLDRERGAIKKFQKLKSTMNEMKRNRGT